MEEAETNLLNERTTNTRQPKDTPDTTQNHHNHNQNRPESLITGSESQEIVGMQAVREIQDSHRNETYIRLLEDELEVHKKQAQTSFEQYETSVEELKASNEELQAIVEELRSATEELETSKEELQAVNEELLSVNHELKLKVEETSLSNNNLQNLIVSTNIATIFVDRALRVKFYTPKIEQLFNIIPSDLDRPLAHLTNNLIYADLVKDGELVLRYLAPVQREIQTNRGEWFVVSQMPYRTMENYIDGVVLTFVDITERKQTEEKLAYQANLLEFTQEAVIAFNSQGEITFWNPGAEQMYGWLANEVLGKAGVEILGDIAGTGLTDQLPGKLTSRSNSRRKKPSFPKEKPAGAGVVSGETRQTRKDGTSLWIETSIRPFYDKEQQPVGYIAVLRDITERKMAGLALQESEDLFRTVADLIPDLLWRTEAGGPTEWVNQRWLEYTGQAWEEARGSGWLDAVHPDDRERTMVYFRQAMETGQRARWEYRLKERTGAYRWFLAQTLPVKNENGEIVQWLGAATDVNEQRLSQDNLETKIAERTVELKELNVSLKEEQIRLAELSNRLLGVQETERRFIARELHDEIGQDLTGLKFILETARRMPPAEKDQHLANALEVMNTLTRQVSELSLSLRPSVLDDQGLLPALVWHIHRYTEQTHLEVDFRHKGLDKRFPTVIETAVYRIVQEALTNVARHAGVERVIVQVIVDEQISLHIEDKGKGFEVAKMFAKHNSTGVSAMQERVELVGGEFSIESSPGLWYYYSNKYSAQKRCLKIGVSELGPVSRGW